MKYLEGNYFEIHTSDNCGNYNSTNLTHRLQYIDHEVTYVRVGHIIDPDLHKKLYESNSEEFTTKLLLLKKYFICHNCVA